MEEIPAGVINGGIFIGGTAVGVLVNAAVKIWTARNQRTNITPQPLEIKSIKDVQSIDQCRSMMTETFRRLGDLEKITSALSERLKDIAEIKEDIKTIMRRTK